MSIYKKHVIDISPRIQKLIVRSFPYLPFKLVYKKEVDIPVADTLSRFTLMDQEDNIKLPIIAVNMITTQVHMNTDCEKSFSNTLECIRKSTVQDEQGSKVTLTQDSLVTRKTCQQIFMNFGHTRKCSPLSQASLLAGPGS